MRTRAVAIAVAVVLVASSLSGLAYLGLASRQPTQAQNAPTSPGYGPGMMGGGGYPQAATTAASSSSTPAGLPTGTMGLAEAVVMMNSPPPDSSVNVTGNAVVFASSDVSITAFAIQPGNATMITGMSPPSYSRGDVFVIGGLIDPTLYVQSGARANFTVVNMDDALYNDFVVSTVAPPYPSTMSQYTTWGGNGMMGAGFQGFAYMMPVLGPADHSAGWASRYSYTITIPDEGSLWYLCTYPGHAQDGMYGRIVTATGSAATTSDTATTAAALTGASTASTATGTAQTTAAPTGLPPGTISVSGAMALLKTPLGGASVSRSADSITFTSSDVNITAFGMMPDDATNLTGMQPPSYAKDDVFVVGGLIDPTIYVPRGATVHLTFVNLDDDMYHNLVFTTLDPPYPYMVMMGMMYGGRYLNVMPVLSPTDYPAGWAPAYSYTVTVPNVANLWYICTYPGHAQTGMYGELVTTG